MMNYMCKLLRLIKLSWSFNKKNNALLFVLLYFSFLQLVTCASPYYSSTPEHLVPLDDSFVPLFNGWSSRKRLSLSLFHMQLDQFNISFRV